MSKRETAVAAGAGWFVDPTPGVHEEFEATRTLAASGSLTAAPGSAAYGRYDLLTVALHEAGHLLGIGHDEAGAGLLADSLPVGTRRLPLDDPEATAAVPSAGIEAGFVFESNEPVSDESDTDVSGVGPAIGLVVEPVRTADDTALADSPTDEPADSTSVPAFPPVDENEDLDALFADFDGRLADELVAV